MPPVAALVSPDLGRAVPRKPYQLVSPDLGRDVPRKTLSVGQPSPAQQTKATLLLWPMYWWIFVA